MKYSPMRRAQLIAPFGVGAMFTAPDGTGMITGGLDGWFDTDASRDLQLEEFRVSEWRLEKQLRVPELRLPPDHRRLRRHQEGRPNMQLDVPALLFPSWHFCPAASCRALHEVKPHHGKRRRCPTCEHRIARGGTAGGKKSQWAPFLAQVPFVAMCADGHLQDFPWREWLHRTPTPRCTAQMYLKSTGGATLAAQTVSCDCGVRPRNLSRITEAFEARTGPDTVLSSQLSETDRYECRGFRPWVDDRVGEGCGLPVRGSLRASTSAYYAHVLSAIYLPGGALGLPDGLIEAIERAPLKYKIDTLRQLEMLTLESVLKADVQGQLKDYSNEDVARALDALDGVKGEAESERDPEDLDPETLRRPEFDVLRDHLVSDDLTVKPQEVGVFDDALGRFFSRVNLVEQLRETRVMYGFSRIAPNQQRPLTQIKAQLWNTEPEFGASWLPAYVVKGEGLFFELNESALQAWEKRPDVVARVRQLATHADRTRASEALQDASLVPRFVLLHTLSHLLINQLVFECGYSSASLRERLFCAGGQNPMAGFLIYTAAGDSEGTMGGLVRMGKPDHLEPAIVAALDRALWCSSDPVCMELGAKGQGPQSMNLAACHACGLLPETACEVFNVFLDRAMVTGTHEHPEIGFMADYNQPK